MNRYHTTGEQSFHTDQTLGALYLKASREKEEGRENQPPHEVQIGGTSVKLKPPCIKYANYYYYCPELGTFQTKVSFCLVLTLVSCR